MGIAKGTPRTPQARANHLGITVEEWTSHMDRGEKWCTTCKAWHPKSAFGPSASRYDGLRPSCREGRNRIKRETYVPVPRPSAGRRFKPPRENDASQARGRVNHLVVVGVIPNPNTLPCVDCGHIGDGPRHEYDHHEGYAAAHHEDVEAVCAPCHHRREHDRRGVVRRPPKRVLSPEDRTAIAGAAQIGVTEDQYKEHMAAGEKWCMSCKSWHPRTEFGVDRGRSDGLRPQCRASRRGEKARLKEQKASRVNWGHVLAPTAGASASVDTWGGGGS